MKIIHQEWNSPTLKLSHSSCCHILLIALCGFAVTVGAASNSFASDKKISDSAVEKKKREFDFWLGKWNVQNEHLQENGRWKTSGNAENLVQLVAGGNAVVERWTGTLHGNKLYGFSLRSYDPVKKHWSVMLNWHGGQPLGFGEMVGSFEDGKIEIFPPRGPKNEKFIFHEIKDNTVKWTQGVKQSDNSWKFTWNMLFTRKGKLPALTAKTLEIEQPPASVLKKFPAARQFDFLIGSWKAKMNRKQADGTWKKGTAEAKFTSMIHGGALMKLMDDSFGNLEYAAMGFDSRRIKWMSLQVDNHDSIIKRLGGNRAGNKIDFTQLGRHETKWREIYSQMTPDSFRWERLKKNKGEKEWESIAKATFRKTDK